MKTFIALLVICVTVFAVPRAIGNSDAGLPAARQGDQQSCPLVTGGVPHVGGPLQSSNPTVLICGTPAVTVGDLGLCVGPPTSVAGGSATVLIGGRPAARQGDVTSHGGTIVQGCPTVLIGG